MKILYVNPPYSTIAERIYVVYTKIKETQKYGKPRDLLLYEYG